MAALQPLDAMDDEGRPPGFVDRYLPALLNQAAHLVVGDFADAVRAHGLSIVEWRVLAILADGEPVSVGLLARKAITKQSTLTRLLDRMAGQGHVERIAAGNDRRLTLVGITTAGRAIVGLLKARAEAQQRRALAGLSAAKQRQLESLLKELIDSLEPPLPGTGKAAGE